MAFSIPVPPRPSGYRLGSGSAPVQIEVFVDIECPFSKKAWPTLLHLVNGYDGEQVAVTAQPVVLCDHRQSWDLTKTAVVVADGDASRFWQFWAFLYCHQQRFANNAFDGKTRKDLFEFCDRIVQEFDPSFDISALAAAKADDGDVAQRAKIPVRYAITRSVWSTPTFFINGSPAADLESSATVGDWNKRLQGLLGG